MSSVRVRHLHRTFGSVTAVDDVSLDIEEGEIFALLGPSGCGKTTILRSISGFEKPDAGDVLIGEKSVSRLPPHERPVGMVFQAYALFPHMTVFDNVAYGLYADIIKSGHGSQKLRVIARMLNRRFGRPPDIVKRRVQEALRTVDLVGYDERFPSQLSGGQQQRVALARAIVVEPEVLLMDEPLSNLDRKLRDAMRVSLRTLLKRIGITVIIVTHDQEEAMSMADRIAVMKDGNILQVGLPDEVYRRPVNPFVAEFIGDANMLTGTIDVATSAGPTLVTANLRLSVSADSWAPESHTGSTVSAMIRPESIRVSAEDAFAPGVGTGGSSTNRLRGTVTTATYLGNSVRYEVTVGDVVLKVDALSGHVVFRGQTPVTVGIDADAIRIL